MVLSVAVVVLIGVVIFLVKNLKKKPDNKVEQFLQNDLANLRRELMDMSQNVDKNLRENSELLRAKVDQKLDATQKSMGTQMESSRKLVEEITKSLVKLEDTNRRVIDTQDELKTLQNVLTNNKTRGNLGEYYLEDILGNVLPAGVWDKQYHFRNGEAVDAIVHLKDGKILPIDSKFPMQNFERMQNSDNKTDRATFREALKKDIKTRIDETAKYIRPNEGTMDFAFMFIPNEALYYDAVINEVGVGDTSDNLVEYAFKQKNVIIVSPTTLLAYLQTVLQGLRSLEIEEKARDIEKNVEKLHSHLLKYNEYFMKVGGSLSTTVNHFNNASKEFAKIDKDVVKIAGGETTIEPLSIDRPRVDD